MEEGPELGPQHLGEQIPLHCPASPLYYVPVEGGRHVEKGLELGPHPSCEQVLFIVQNFH
jgi:hypothetical protein